MCPSIYSARETEKGIDKALGWCSWTFASLGLSLAACSLGLAKGSSAVIGWGLATELQEFTFWLPYKLRHKPDCHSTFYEGYLGPKLYHPNSEASFSQIHFGSSMQSLLFCFRHISLSMVPKRVPMQHVSEFPFFWELNAIPLYACIYTTFCYLLHCIFIPCSVYPFICRWV